MRDNFWEQGNLTRVTFREHLNLFLGNKGETPIFSREQGNMHPPWEALITKWPVARVGHRPVGPITIRRICLSHR